jgi:hypothetical protein
MSELTTYNKVWCWMEQCQVGDNLWVKADEAEQQIAYWKRCVETSKSIHQIDNETIRKRLDQIRELQYTFNIQNDRALHWAGKYDSECAAHTKTLHKLNTARLLANLWACATVLLAAWELNERVGIL